MIQPLWRTVWRFLKKLKIELPYDAAIPLLGIYPEKTIIQKDTCTPMFTAALFTIARTWKQPKCPLTAPLLKQEFKEVKNSPKAIQPAVAEPELVPRPVCVKLALGCVPDSGAILVGGRAA